MPYVIYNAGSGLVEARDIAELSAAVLQSARYDGWGAEYLRDGDGRMALRCSRGHIGNNPWLATGEEPPAYGHTSDLEDDDEAIAAVARAIAGSAWGGNMKGLEVRDEADFIRERLQLALDEYEGDTGPGEWMPVEALPDKGRALMAYKWPDGMTEEHPDWGDADAPWKRWGGEAIIDLVGGSIADGYGIDGVDHAEVVLK